MGEHLKDRLRCRMTRGPGVGAQAEQAVADPGLGGAERNVQPTRDLAVGEALEVGKGECLTLCFREPGDGTSELCGLEQTDRLVRGGVGC